MIKSRAKAAVKAMKHQLTSLDHDKTTPIVFDMSDPGTGKTYVRITAFAGRRRKGGGKLIVLAPRSLLRVAWANDFAKFAPDMKVVIADAANREKAFASDADVYVTNHDGVKWLVAKLKPAALADFSEFVVDESTAFKHHTSQRARAMSKLAHMRIATKPIFKYRSCLTATPTSNGISDIWHQMHLLDGGARLGPTFYGFRGSVCEPRQIGFNKAAIQWVDKPGAEEAVFGLISDIVMRHRFEDCVDIPPTHQYTVDYTLTAKQLKTYKDMELAQILLLSGGQKGAGPKITAINAAAVTTKLVQISSGAVYDNDHKYHVIDTARYEMLMDMAQARRQPLVYFFWKHQRDALTAEAEARGMRFCVLDGSASDGERNAMVTQYQRGMYDIMFAHPKSAAHGLTLTFGTSTIWSCPPVDLEWWKQGNKRQARIGQTRKTEVVVCIAKDTIEERIYNDILMAKDQRMSNLLELFAA